ncbi:MAG TPA: TIGR03564 family F420-dependent LLM class oxidoreductase [Dehalococcoidia bacterium]|nr:TIGR03564 family F420-dependent LLM class oxidoreductase [Dehalococcoidia bacterium]
MRIGVSIAQSGEPNDLNSAVNRVIQAEKDGFEAITFNSGAVGEPLTVIAVAGRETSRIQLMTTIVVTYTRHPFLLAQQALTANAATGGRLTLGIGPSHAVAMERLGFDWSRAGSHTREYVTILKSLIDTQKVQFKGEFFNVETSLQLTWASSCPVLIAALAPRMLQTAGELADGTVTWLAGLKTIRDHIKPRISHAASAAGRPAPRICVGLPVAVCDNPAEAREQAAKTFSNYGSLPVYRRVLDVEGGNAEDVLVAGNENEVEAQLRAFAAAGATDFTATPFAVGDNVAASVQRTRELLKSLVGKI